MRDVSPVSILRRLSFFRQLAISQAIAVTQYKSVLYIQTDDRGQIKIWAHNINYHYGTGAGARWARLVCASLWYGYALAICVEVFFLFLFLNKGIQFETSLSTSSKLLK